MLAQFQPNRKMTLKSKFGSARTASSLTLKKEKNALAAIAPPKNSMMLSA